MLIHMPLLWWKKMSGSSMGNGAPKMRSGVKGILVSAANGTIKAAISSSLMTRLTAIELVK